MKGRFTKALGYHGGRKGITGLETAIILIAFVTVAAVLAYSVLSAGIFSSEKGKQAVYSGLSQAKASMDVVGGVKAMSTDNVVASGIEFEVTSVLDDDNIDMGKIIMNYTDDAIFAENVSFTVDNLAPNGSNQMLGPAEVALINVSMAQTKLSGTSLVAYDTFTLEMVPTTGATITIQRTLPGYLDDVMDLH